MPCHFGAGGAVSGAGAAHLGRPQKEQLKSRLLRGVVPSGSLVSGLPYSAPRLLGREAGWHRELLRDRVLWEPPGKAAILLDWIFCFAPPPPPGLVSFCLTVSQFGEGGSG